MRQMILQNSFGDRANLKSSLNGKEAGRGAHSDTAPIANGPERGVYAASSFGSPQANRFVDAQSDTEAA